MLYALNPLFHHVHVLLNLSATMRYSRHSLACELGHTQCDVNAILTDSCIDNTNYVPTDSAGCCNTDSLSVSHWRSGTRALDPVIESDSIPPSELVAARPHKSLGVDTEKSPPVSPVRNEDGMTVQLYPAFSGSSKTQVAESTSPNQQVAVRPTAQQQTSLPGSAGTQSARATSASGSTSGGSGAGGPVRSSGGYKPGVASVQHVRNVSTVSSTGASPEYEEDDLDEDWRMLLEEVNGLLASKNYTPIRNAKYVAF